MGHLGGGRAWPPNQPEGREMPAQPRRDIPSIDGWNQIKSILERESRFYNTSVVEELMNVFGKPGAYADLYKDRSVVREVMPNSEFNIFRARDFGSVEGARKALLAPEWELARPPSGKARSGRMNADGISVFYGANDEKVALAEIRPPVGSYVVIARFCVSKSKKVIRLLDVEGLSRAYGRHIESSPNKNTKIEFIKNFGRQVTMPIVPENESKEYIITQVISDYLSSRNDIKIDGLIYKSAQAGTRISENVVLFHKSSMVKDLDGAKAKSLIERINKINEYFNIFNVQASIEMRKSCIENYISEDRKDDHSVALELDASSISLYFVKNANFDTRPKIHPDR